MTNRPTPDDDFDDMPSLPNPETAQNPFDDPDFDVVDNSPVQATRAAGFDPRYAEIANELSQMDAAERQSFEGATDDWDLSDTSSDLESLDDLTLDDHYEPMTEVDADETAIASAQPLMSDAPASQEDHQPQFGAHSNDDVADWRAPEVTDPFVHHSDTASENFDADMLASAGEAPAGVALEKPDLPVTDSYAGNDLENDDFMAYGGAEEDDFSDMAADGNLDHGPDHEHDDHTDMSSETIASDVTDEPYAGQFHQDQAHSPAMYDDADTDDTLLGGGGASQHHYDDFDEFEEPQTDNDRGVSGGVSGAAMSAPEEETFDPEDEDEAPPAPIITKGTRIPLLDLGPVGFDKLAFSFHKRTRAVHNLLRRRYSVYGFDLLPMIDRKCAEWLAKSKTPYRVEIEDMAKKFKQPGIYAMNLFFEFGCTSAVAVDPEGRMRLLHTMDWSVKGLGHLLMAARRQSDHGKCVNITWPGYVGCLQVIAPGRFAAAINQAPTGTSKQPWLNWISSKMKWKSTRDMPPAFLLRKVFEECKDFESAVSMLEKTPICFPAIFSIVGIQEGEFAIIERTENDRKTTKRQTAVTNHWLNNEFSGQPIGYKSTDRLVTIKSRIDKGVENWSWLRAPVLNPTTRMAMDLNPGTARMRVIGYEGSEPVTVPLDVYVD